MGHSIVFDDPYSTNNVLKNNLILLPNSSILIEQTDATSAGIFLRGPMNIL